MLRLAVVTGLIACCCLCGLCGVARAESYTVGKTSVSYEVGNGVELRDTLSNTVYAKFSPNEPIFGSIRVLSDIQVCAFVCVCARV